jgi:hypothetical protein
VIRGFVERLERNHVSGWAFDADRPDEVALIEVSANGVLLGSTMADLLRPDLQKLAYGKGNHAFILKLDPHLPEERLQSVEVHASLASGNRTLLGRLVPIPDRMKEQQKEIVSSSQFRDESQFPVFILGAPRSGTSAMLLALLSLPQYVGMGEGHLLHLVNHLLDSLQAFYTRKESVQAIADGGTLIAKVPIEFFDRRIRSIFVDLIRARFNGRYWVDKTPSLRMLDAAPLLQEIWPNARFIFMKRRAIESVVSRLNKFPKASFAEHCQGWTAFMELWIQTRDKLSGAAMEVEQLTVAQHPELSASAVGSFLKLSESEIQLLAHKLKSDRPQRTSIDSAAIFDFQGSNWSADQKGVFLKLCGPMMEAFGYSLGKEYFAPGSQFD